MKKWWWPFGGESETERAENQFLEMLHEASVRTDDLRQAAQDMRAERLKRLHDAQAKPPNSKFQTG